MSKPVIFFDGVCGLCNGFIDFIFRIDRKSCFLVSTLQGDYAKKILIHTVAENENFKSIILQDETGLHYGSTAVLKILSRLGGGWKIIGFLQVIPMCFRDKIYYFIADRRYGWFGKQDHCRLPTNEEKTRFIP